MKASHGSISSICASCACALKRFSMVTLSGLHWKVLPFIYDIDVGF